MHKFDILEKVNKTKGLNKRRILTYSDYFGPEVLLLLFYKIILSTTAWNKKNHKGKLTWFRIVSIKNKW